MCCDHVPCLCCTVDKGWEIGLRQQTTIVVGYRLDQGQGRCNVIVGDGTGLHITRQQCNRAICCTISTPIAWCITGLRGFGCCQQQVGLNFRDCIPCLRHTVDEGREVRLRQQTTIVVGYCLDQGQDWRDIVVGNLADQVFTRAKYNRTIRCTGIKPIGCQVSWQG